MEAVPLSEAVSILREMLDSPDKVRAVQVVDDATWGPAPFFLDWRGSEAEVTLQFSGGAVSEVASIRIGTRFTNAHQWGDNPWDELSEAEIEVLELSIR